MNRQEGVILLTGAKGQTARDIILSARKEGIPLVSFDRKGLDITDISEVSERIDAVKPSLVINGAAYTAVDRAEEEKGRAFAVNRDGPANLALCCKRAGIPLIHISTDYVFDGEKEGAYMETDRPNPSGVYAMSKWEGEEAVKNALDRHLIVRVSWVFGYYGHNFVHTILKTGQELGSLRVVADQYGCPTFTGHIAGVLLALSQKIKIGGDIPWGTYHYCDRPVTNWCDFTRVIFDRAHSRGLVSKIPEITPIPGSEYKTPVKRPSNSALDCSKIRERFNIYQRSWKDGLDTFFETMERENQNGA